MAIETPEVIGELEAIINSLAPEVPAAPVEEAVTFEDRDGGLWLSYDNYRALERNIIAMREYQAKLLVIINYYTSGQAAHEASVLAKGRQVVRQMNSITQQVTGEGNSE